MKRMIVDTGGRPLTIKERLSLAAAGRYQYHIVEGPVRACSTCGFFDCVCRAREIHEPGCRFLKALTSPVGIPCEAHDYDVCPTCDLCTCSSVTNKKRSSVTNKKNAESPRGPGLDHVRPAPARASSESTNDHHR